jgi:peptidoglycan/xylan/chitin deacetylase (PgdA/CDA1 family)
MDRTNPALMRRLVLNYHAVAGSGHGCADVDPIYGLDAPTLRTHLALIREMGLPVLPVQASAPLGSAGEALGVSLTFDDGHASDGEVVMPLLAEFGMSATFFVPSHLLRQDPGCAGRVRALTAAGHAVAAHGHRHRYLDGLAPAAQAEELRVSKALLEDHLGSAVRLFALPGGKYRPLTLDLARAAGYAHVLSTQFGVFDDGHPPFLLPRWTIKRGTSLSLLARVLAADPWTLRWQTGLYQAKRTLNRLLGNALTDRLHYLLHG